MAAGGLIIDPDLISYTMKKLNTSIVWAAGEVTVTSVLPHGYIAGDLVHIGGLDNQQMEGSFVVLAGGLTSNVFKFTLAAGPVYPSTTPGYTHSATTELLIDQVRKSVKLNRAGNLTADGVTIKCLYSKLKEVWMTDVTLIKFPFPMTPITDEQFEFKDGWTVEKRYSSVTEVRIPNVSGVAGQNTITAPGGAFIHPSLIAETYVGYNVPGLPANNGGTSGQEGAKIVSVSPDGNTITMDRPNVGDFTSRDVSFWNKNDHTHWLIRTGGWAIKGIDGNTQEEWANFTTLGNLGAQGSIIQLANVATTASSTTVTCTSTAGIIAGSYITAPNIYDGTKVASITDATTLVLSFAAYKTASGGIATVRPKDQVYYQQGSSATASKIFALTGAVNQALRYKQYQTTFTANTSVASIAITGMLWNVGTQKVSFTATGHGYVVGDAINIVGSVTSGATPQCLNGVKIISDVAGDVVSFVVAYNPGTVTTQGTVSDSPTLRSVSSTAGLYVGLNTTVPGVTGGGAITSIIGDRVTLTVATVATTTGASLTTGSYTGASNNVMNLFVREQGYTYAVSAKADIGESLLAYKKYAFPLSNTQDLKISHTDAQVDADTPYTTMNITWAPQTVACTNVSGQAALTGITSTVGLSAGMELSGTGITPGTTILSVDSSTQITMSAVSSSGVTSFGSKFVRLIGGVSRSFNVVIDADTGLAAGASGTARTAQIYEFVQRSLRKSTDIDVSAGTKTGNITRELLKFVGDTLYTLHNTDGGVYIDNFNTADINSVVFADNTGVNRTYPYTAAGTILPNTYLVTDGTTNIKTTTGDITGTTTVTLTAGTTANIFAGYVVLGVGIPAGTTVASVTDSTHFTLSQAATNGVGVAFTTYTTNAIYRAFFKQLSTGRKYGTVDALLVKRSDNVTDVSGYVISSTLPFDFDYDGNTQAVWQANHAYVVGDEYRNSTTWYRVTTDHTSGASFSTANAATIDGPSIVVTALGKTNAQAVVTEGTIARSTSNAYSLVAALERNYFNPA